MRTKLLLLLPALFATTAQAYDFTETKLLVIGDTHLLGSFREGFLGVLDAQKDLRTEVYAICGTGPVGWSIGGFKSKCRKQPVYYSRTLDGKVSEKAQSTDKLVTLVSLGLPDLVVIELGTSQLDGDVRKAEGPIRTIMRQAKAGGAECAWIGPPNVKSVPKKKLDAYYKVLESVAKSDKCALIDSRELTDAKDVDRTKVGFKGAAGVAWGKKAAAQVVRIVRAKKPAG
jgi:hypothetical protein